MNNKERIKYLMKITGSGYAQAKGLLTRVKNAGTAWDKVDWDRLQGKDLSYRDKVSRLESMIGTTYTQTHDQYEDVELAASIFEEQQHNFYSDYTGIQQIGHIRFNHNTGYYYSTKTHRRITKRYAVRMIRGFEQGKTQMEAEGHPNYEYKFKVYWGEDTANHSGFEHELTMTVITDMHEYDFIVWLDEHGESIADKVNKKEA